MLRRSGRRGAPPLVPKPSGVQKPKRPTRPPLGPKVAVRPVSSNVVKMIRDKLSGKLTGNKDTQLTIIENILKYVSIKQSIDSSMMSPALVSAQSKSLTVDMKNIQSVYLFLVNLFCDQVHDSSSTKSGAPKGLERMNVVLKLPTDSPPLKTFTKYIDTIEWLDNDIKKEIKVVGGEYQKLLTDSFYLSKKKDGTEYYNMDETTYMYNSLKLQKTIDPDPKNSTFVYTSSVPTGYSGFPSSRPMISFDQSSKASGPSVVTATTVNALNSTASPLYVISLPVISDLGSTQPSNPIGTFYENMKKCIDIVQNNPGILEKALKEGGSTPIDVLVAKRYIVLDNSEFESTITYKDKIVLKTKFFINSTDGKVLVNIATPNATGSKKRFVTAPVISASNMTSTPSVSNWIFKTIGDLNILLISIASQSAALTGDRTAGAFYMLFSFLKKQGWLSVDSNKNIMFLFEGAGSNDIVVTTNFRTRGSANYVNYLKNKIGKTQVTRQNVPVISPIAENRNRSARNVRNGAIESLIRNMGAESIDTEKYFHTKKLLTGEAFRQFEALMNSNNVGKKSKVFTIIKKFPTKANVQPSDAVKREFYKTLASVPAPKISNEPNENMPNANKTRFINTLTKFGINRPKIERIAGGISDDRANYYANILKGTTPSATFVASFNRVSSVSQLNSMLATAAIRNSIEKLYRNVPQMSSLKDEEKLSKFNQWLQSPDNTPYLKQFVNIKRLPGVPAIKDLKQNMVSAINLLGNNQQINNFVFETIKVLLQYGQS